MNREEIIDILTAIQVVDHRTVGEGDITMWGAILADLPKNLALQAVIDHRREQPGVWLEPGHIYTRVRAIRQDRAMRQPLPIEAPRDDENVNQARLDAMLTASKIGRPIPEDDAQLHKRLAGPSPLSVRCPHCRASAGARCYNPATKRPFRGHHPSRIDTAAGLPPPAVTPRPMPPTPTAIADACLPRLRRKRAHQGRGGQPWGLQRVLAHRRPHPRRPPTHGGKRKEPPHMSLAIDIDRVDAAELHNPAALDKRLREQAHDFDDSWARLVNLILEAKNREIHKPLGFKSWPDYIADVTRTEMPNLSRSVEQRRQMVAMLAGEGMSQRTIADAVGVSNATISRDQTAIEIPLAEAEVLQDVTPEPPTVVGRDGKSYPAAQPKPKPSVNTFSSRFYRALSALQDNALKLDILTNDKGFAEHVDEVCAAHRDGVVWAQEILTRVLEQMHTNQAELF